MSKIIKVEKIIGKVRTSMFGPIGSYKIEDGIIKQLKLNEQKNIEFEAKDLI